MCPSSRTDNTVDALPDASLDNDRDVEIPSDLSRVGFALCILHDRARRAHDELPVQAQPVRDRLGEGEGEIAVLASSGEELEREHGDGSAARGRIGCRRRAGPSQVAP